MDHDLDFEASPFFLSLQFVKSWKESHLWGITSRYPPEKHGFREILQRSIAGFFTGESSDSMGLPQKPKKRYRRGRITEKQGLFVKTRENHCRSEAGQVFGDAWPLALEAGFAIPRPTSPGKVPGRDLKPLAPEQGIWPCSGDGPLAMFKCGSNFQLVGGLLAIFGNFPLILGLCHHPN